MVASEQWIFIIQYPRCDIYILKLAFSLPSSIASPQINLRSRPLHFTYYW